MKKLGPLVLILLFQLLACSQEESLKPQQSPRDELINYIALNLQAIAPVNLGSFQLLQIRQSIENLNFSDQELQDFAFTVEQRVKSNELAEKYSKLMYGSMLKEFEQIPLPVKEKSKEIHEK